ncbi:MAG: efflux RND transporter periplasmic adaptor subunit [Bacteroidota bacterium]
MTKLKYLLIPLSLLASACGEEEKKDLGTANTKPSVVEVVKVEPTDVLREISVPGTIIPNEELQLYSEISGRIESINFKEGQTVSKGAVLVQMDSDILRAQKKEQQVALDLAKKDEARKKSLLENKGISLEEYERSASTLASVQAQIDLVNVQISKTVIRAPFSGRIGLRRVSEGAFITNTTLITSLVQENPIKVEFAVSERYAGAVKNGQTIEFKLDRGQKNYTAKVYAFEPVIDEGTRMLSVRASLSNDGNLISGAFVSVKYKLGMEVDAFMVPAESIVPILKGQKVLVVRNGKVVEIPVDVGIRTADKVQVIGELQPGDQVLISGLLAVRPGMPVKTKLIKK